jgi:uncharacterized protein YcbK (DUF882 family)
MSLRMFSAVAALAAGLLMASAPQSPVVAASTSESCLPSALRSKLSQIRSQFGSITVVSTHRPGARIPGMNRPSYHASCQAVDFVPPSGKYGAVLRWLQSNHGGGVGQYTCMSHIHIDTGPGYHWSKCR